jgi:hypothetical protein
MHYTAEQLAQMKVAYVADFIMACVRAKVRLPSTEQAAAYFCNALALDWAVRHWIMEQRTSA